MTQAEIAQIVRDAEARLQADAEIIARYPDQPEKVRERMEERRALIAAVKQLMGDEDAR